MRSLPSPLAILMLIFSVMPCIYSQPSAPDGKETPEDLILRLTELDAEGVGLSSRMTGADFPPVAGQHSFSMGMLSPAPRLTRNETLTKLVALGPAAMPALVKHIDDKRPTKLVLEHGGALGTMWYAQEIGSAEHNEREQTAIREAGIKSGEGLPKLDRSHIKAHTITIGDVCFVALGMITNRGYRAVRYQPSACIVINSPVQSPELARAVRNLWGPNGENAHRDSLLAWLREDFRNGSAAAATRMLFYFPDETAGEVLAELQQPGRKPYEEAQLVRAAAWVTHPEIRALVKRKVMGSANLYLAEYGAVAFGGGKEPAEYEALAELITKWKAARNGSRAAQAFLHVALAAWPDRRSQTLEVFFKGAPRECVIAGLISCYGVDALPVGPLIPLLGRKEDGYGRYLIHGEGARDKPGNDDFLTYRIRDNVWELISRSLGDTEARCTGNRKAMDARIRSMQARLNGEVSTWPFTAEEIESRKADRTRIAGAKEAALREVDSKTTSPAHRALLILQDDRSGVELWLRSAARLLHPATENKEKWSLAFANRHRFKSRLMEEFSPEQRTEFEEILTRRSTDLLGPVRRGDWAGGDAVAMVCLCACVTRNAVNPALALAMKLTRAAFDKHGWPDDSEQGRLLTLIEALLERRTAGSDALLFSLAMKSRPGTLTFDTQKLFSLIATWHERPEVKKAAEYCFLNPKSAWHLSKCEYLEASHLGSARLLKVPAFRKALAAAIMNEKVTGQLTITPDKPDYCWIKWKEGSSGMGIEKGETAGVNPGEEMPVRACDALLEGVRNAVFSGYEGPEFKIYWPLEKRNTARQQWLEYLKKPE